MLGSKAARRPRQYDALQGVLLPCTLGGLPVVITHIPGSPPGYARQSCLRSLEYTRFEVGYR